MTLIAFIRHGPTAWNAAKRLQGHTDVALSEAGRKVVANWRPPAALADATWFVSPLLRCVETAQWLGVRQPQFEPRLMEMSWGRWEGRTIADLRAADPAGMEDIEAMGLDFCAPGGESPRMVQDRVMPFLQERAASGVTTGAVTHKGLIRAIYSLATGWPLLGKPPDKMNWESAHLFRLDTDGTPHVEQLCVPLDGNGKGAG